MRLLNGTKVTDAPPGWREALLRDGRRVVIDLGAGDGRYAYESARGDASSVYVAVDPDADALGEYAYRAARKPARGGVDNARFVVASVEALPEELRGLAGLVRVNFPWGGLLRGLLAPDDGILHAVASLAAPDGRFEIVMSYDPAHDPNAFAGEPLPPLDAAYIEAVLAPAYAEAGLAIDETRRLSQDEALALPSNWGRRLLHARPRDVYFVAGSVFQAD
ncbi:MAG TPA: class I SAM-dependent methyltransferase [Dehalococcoidia bacterium]|nr:class I SAM-dependent methyltransferase [Dehalococcoidia bacterium]